MSEEERQKEIADTIGAIGLAALDLAHICLFWRRYDKEPIDEYFAAGGILKTLREELTDLWQTKGDE